MLNQDAVARILPFAVYLSFIVITDALAHFGMAASELRWLYAFKILAVLAALGWYWRRYTELQGPRPGARMALAAVAAGLVVLVLWINLNAGWMQMGTPTGFDPRNNGTLDWPLVAVRVCGAALVVPVMEELFWRSFLMRWIEAPGFLAVSPAAVRARAFAVTAVLFGVEHGLWLAGIVAGAAYGWLYMRSRNLWVPILAHGVTNGVLGGWIISTGNWTYW